MNNNNLLNDDDVVERMRLSQVARFDPRNINLQQKKCFKLNQWGITLGERVGNIEIGKACSVDDIFTRHQSELE